MQGATLRFRRCADANADAEQATPLGHMEYTDRTLPSIVHAHGANAPNSVAIEAWDEVDGVTLTVSYGQLSAQVRAAARFLEQVGRLIPGDRCALHSHNTVAYACMSLGTMSLGATAVHLNWRQPDEVNLRLLKDLDIKLLLTSAPFRSLVEHTSIHLSNMRSMSFESICAMPLHEALPFNAQATQLAAAHSISATSSMVAIGSDTPKNTQHAAAIFFTGGTTGMPKAVPHTHATLLCNADGYMREHGGPLDPRAHARAGSVCFTPYFHVMGFVASLVTNLVAGARAAILASADARLSPSLVLAACRQLRPTVLHTVPWVVEGLASMVAAAHCPTEVGAETEDFGSVPAGPIGTQVITRVVSERFQQMLRGWSSLGLSTARDLRSSAHDVALTTVRTDLERAGTANGHAGKVGAAPPLSAADELARLHVLIYGVRVAWLESPSSQT